MKEIKVATLTKEEVKELKELSKKRQECEISAAKLNSAIAAFWGRSRVEHSLFEGHHYIVGNSIYKQDTE